MGFVPAESVLVEFLTDTFDGCWVCTETDDLLSENLPVIRVERIGGFERSVVLDVARVDVDVFAATRSEARSLSEDVRSELVHTLPGKAISDAIVGEVVTAAAPARVPHDDSSLRRYSATYEVSIQSNPLVRRSSHYGDQS